MTDLSTAPTEVLNATYCATLVDEWVRAGVTDAVVSPGSRSTPMALALADRPEIALHVHHDERAAGFTALGIGLASGRPAVVLTTSGTAAVELHPAVVEAHQAAVPLIVATADRPPELHGVGAPQTVDQHRLYGTSTRWFVDPGPPAPAASGSWRSLAARVVAEATSGVGGPGPVHLNLPFREPLLGLPADLPEGRDEGRPWHTAAPPRPSIDDEVLRPLVAGARRVVLVVGARCGDPRALLAAAERAGWPVLADARSGCRLDHPAVVTTADAWLRHPDLTSELRPDLVVRLGEPHASKVLGAWLAGSGARQVAIDPDGRWFDADRCVDAVLHADPVAVVERLVHLHDGSVDVGWIERWQHLERAGDAVLDRELRGAGAPEVTEPAVARAVVAALERRHAEAALVVASSMPVRDVEWYGGTTGQTRVFANRGANGIDGVVSTAMGVALAHRGSGVPTVALVGDVAFLHDSNALLGATARGVDLTVVVVDNDGGGIFSFLPQGRELDPQRFELLFGTPHGVDLPALAAAHGVPADHLAGHGVDHLDAVLDRAIDLGGFRLVVARTDRASNVAVHDALHAAVHAALP